MRALRNRYFAAGVCVLLFLLAQAFQALAYWLWIPASHGPSDDLVVYLMGVDRIRTFLVMSSIPCLVVPYVAIALRYYRVVPALSLLGLIAGLAFVGLEVTYRSIDFFVVGEWAERFHNSTDNTVRTVILGRFEVWNEIVRGWYFPLLTAHLLASCAFGIVTMRETGVWNRLGTIAFVLNALRLLGRLLGTFGGQGWLSSLNDRLYFPSVAVINVLLAVWFFHFAAREKVKLA